MAPCCLPLHATYLGYGLSLPQAAELTFSVGESDNFTVRPCIREHAGACAAYARHEASHDDHRAGSACELLRRSGADRGVRRDPRLRRGAAPCGAAGHAAFRSCRRGDRRSPLDHGARQAHGHGPQHARPETCDRSKRRASSRSAPKDGGGPAPSRSRGKGARAWRRPCRSGRRRSRRCSGSLATRDGRSSAATSTSSSAPLDLSTIPIGTGGDHELAGQRRSTLSCRASARCAVLCEPTHNPQEHRS